MLSVPSGRFSVELAHEIPDGRAGGVQLVALVLELELQIDNLLFEGGDAGFEPLCVDRPADADLAPDLFAQHLAEAVFEAADLGGEPGGAGIGRQEVGL
ncbi:hypothetical protein ACFWA5_45480 [Streptomyces mirabilis]|uniref:hypothetical protein n=1 Tax=Streptomyces mirabilis TaxID=68239 RepID=UPI003657DBC3